MPGILDIYVRHVENHIAKHLKDDTIKDISRHQIELEILRTIDKYKFPIEMKMSWYHTILSTQFFEATWRLVCVRHNQLTAVNTARYVPDDSNIDFTVPPGLPPTPSPDFAPEKSGYGKKRKSGSASKRKTANPITPAPTSSIRSDSESDSPASDGDGPTPSQIALAAKLSGIGQGSSQDSTNDFGDTTHPFDKGDTLPESMLGSDPDVLDPSGLTRETGDDGAYGAPRKSAGLRGGGGAKKKQASGRAKGTAKYMKNVATGQVKRKRGERLTNCTLPNTNGAAKNGETANGRK